MRRMLAGFALLLLAACSKPHPPVGKWEGGLDKGGTLVTARVEVLASGEVKVSAPDITNLFVDEGMRERVRRRLASDLVGAWDTVTPRPFDFDGKTFRKPGHVAPEMVWDKDTGQMTLELYIGANPALPVVLRPVDGFHDNPFGSG